MKKKKHFKRTRLTSMVLFDIISDPLAFPLPRYEIKYALVSSAFMKHKVNISRMEYNRENHEGEKKQRN
jgi:hypothetical protein